MSVELRGEGAVLDQRRLVVNDEAVDLGWEITESTVRMELIPSAIPTLLGYGVVLVPPCPNPDPDLTWT